jgi:hypothetical protein
MSRHFSFRGISGAFPAWALAAILLWAGWSRAEEPPEPRRRMENRFLFVIDTSLAMKARAGGAQEAVAALLASGIKGELRKGDTIGLWTYSDSLNTDFPMEIWSEEKKDRIVKEAGDFLRDASRGKHSHLEKALPAVFQVLAKSERMTVIFIFDGTGAIKGTPFDKDINDLHRRHARAFRSAREPFVTILAARNGKVFDYTVNYPNAVMVPHTADPLPPPETNAPPPVVAAAPPPPPPASPPVEPKPPPRKIEIILSGSNFTHNAITPAPAAGNVAAVVTPMPAPAPVAVTSAPPAAEAAPIAVQAAPAPVEPPPAPAVTTEAKPVPPAPAPRPAPVAVAPAAPAAAPISAGQQAAMFIMAFSLLTIAVVLVLFLIRRSRGGPQTSLISQSLDRSR